MYRNALYKGRTILSFLLLLITLYFILYAWFTLPPPALFLDWQSETSLTVLDIIIEDDYLKYFQPADIILKVDGRPIHRGQPVFYPPLKTGYTFVIQRENEIITQNVEIPDRSVIHASQLSTGLTALGFWLIGFITAWLSRPNSMSSVYIGLGFQLIGAGIVSPGPSNYGAPGAWIISRSLIFFFPLIMLYLGFMPRITSLGKIAHKLLRWTSYALSALAILAAVEVLFLFPDTSFKNIIGIRSSMILAVITGISLVTSGVILLARLLRAPKESYERQQLSILILFFSLAVIPLSTILILPLRQYLFIPYPLTYSLFLLAPIGYFFVLHRHGYLQLDAVIGRAITFVILVLAIILIYATGSYFLDIVFDVEFDIIQRNGVFIALLGVALIGQRQIQTFVDLLIYGREQLDSVSILKVTAMLSADPAPSTMADVVSQIADVMNSQQVAVMIKDKHTYKLLAGIATINPFELADTKELQQTFLRARDLREPFDLPGWVELSIPIDIQGEIHGLFLLSRPLNGLFNSRQIKRLHDVADVLAFGLQVIRLLNIVHKVPTRIEYEKMLQFQKIATDIHNRPLHTLAMIRPHLKGEQIEVQSAIQQATKDLRRIMAGLHPPELEKSIEWMTREVVREFEENHDHEVHIAIDIQNEKRVPKHIKYVVHAVLTEALNNVVKHAQATTIHVSLCYSSDLRLTVSDDGLGMEIATMSLNGALQDNHFGLAHMQRWAMMGGGRLFIRGNEPTGLVVELALPEAFPATLQQ